MVVRASLHRGARGGGRGEAGARRRRRVAWLAIAALLVQIWLPLVVGALTASPPGAAGHHAEAPAPGSGQHHPGADPETRCPLCVIAQIATVLPGGTSPALVAAACRRHRGPSVPTGGPRARRLFRSARPRAPPLAMQST